jgi:hypothetical protein
MNHLNTYYGGCLKSSLIRHSEFISESYACIYQCYEKLKQVQFDRNYTFFKQPYRLLKDSW